MKLKKVLAVCLAAVLTFSLAGCGDKKTFDTTTDDSAVTDDTVTEDPATEDTTTDDSADDTLNYADIVLGEDYTDITTTITWFANRTDLLDSADPLSAHPYSEYIAAFNALYPNITVEVDATTNYNEDALLKLSSDDWGDIMMIPAIDMNDLSKYFIPYGSLDVMEDEIRFASRWLMDDQVYGVASTGTAQGIVYNKRIFSEARISNLLIQQIHFRITVMMLTHTMYTKFCMMQ